MAFGDSNIHESPAVQSIPEVYRNSPKKRSGTSSRSIAHYRRTTQLEVDISRFLNVTAHFKRM
jgi:hypothetical protein